MALAPIHVFWAAFVIAAMGGLAAFLRSNKEVTARGVVSSSLYSGVMGLTIALLWYNHCEGIGNVYFLLGVAGLTGIGGVSAVDFVLKVLKRGGVHITIQPAEDEDTGVVADKPNDEDEDEQADSNQGSGK